MHTGFRIDSTVIPLLVLANGSSSRGIPTMVGHHSKKKMKLPCKHRCIIHLWPWLLVITGYKQMGLYMNHKWGFVGTYNR